MFISKGSAELALCPAGYSTPGSGSHPSPGWHNRAGTDGVSTGDPALCSICGEVALAWERCPSHTLSLATCSKPKNRIWGYEARELALPLTCCSSQGTAGLIPLLGSTVELAMVAKIWISQPKGMTSGELALPLAGYALVELARAVLKSSP